MDVTVSRIQYYVCTYAYARFQSLLPSIIYDGSDAPLIEAEQHKDVPEALSGRQR